MLESDISATAFAKMDVCLSESVRKFGQAQQEYMNQSNVMGKACNSGQLFTSCSTLFAELHT